MRRKKAVAYVAAAAFLGAFILFVATGEGRGGKSGLEEADVNEGGGDDAGAGEEDKIIVVPGVRGKTQRRINSGEW
jgi:hypothetical protein